MKKILLMILLCIPFIVEADTFTYKETVYAFEEVDSSCVNKEFFPIAVINDGEVIYGHASGDDQYIKLGKDGKCSEVTKEDFIKMNSHKPYEYEFFQNEQGKYVIKKIRGDEYAYFVKTQDTDIIKDKEYIIIEDDVRVLESSPKKEELDKYYEHILLSPVDSLELNPNTTYYKKTDLSDVYEIVENPKAEDLYKYFVRDNYTPEIFDVVNIKSIDGVENISYYQIITNDSEDKFYLMTTEDSGNRRVFDMNGNEPEQFKGILNTFFLTDELFVGVFPDKTVIYDEKLNVVYSEDNNVYGIHIAYSNYSHYLMAFNGKGSTKISKLNEHKLLEGKDQNSNNQDLTFKFSGRLENLNKIELNDKELDAKNYEVKSGSTIITLNNDYLKTLATGEYNLKVTYNDGGYSNATFTVEETEEDTEADTTLPPNPETSDNIILIFYVLVISFISGISIILIKKRTQ